MNHLAHFVLSGSDPDVQLGGLLGDFVRGAIDPTLSPRVQHGIALHRAIDTFTDTHPNVIAARNMFEAPFRRYAGILIDIWFDHLLARDFARWSVQPLDTTSASFIDLLARNHDELPVALQRFSRYVKANNLPTEYRDLQMINHVLAGVGTRLSRENPLHLGLSELERLEPQLEGVFESFFPQLQSFSKRQRGS